MKNITPLEEPDFDAQPETSNGSATTFQLSNKLELVAQTSPKELFAAGNLREVIDSIKEIAGSMVCDLSTAAGRKEVISMAATIAKTKQFIDKTGKQLTETARDFTKRVNEERKWSFEELEELQKKVRQPVTDLENAEKARIELRDSAYAIIINADQGIESLTREEAQGRIDELGTVDMKALGSLEGEGNIKRLAQVRRLNSRLSDLAEIEEKEIQAEKDRKIEAERLQALRDKEIADNAAANAKAIADAAAADALANQKAASDAALAKQKAESDAKLKAIADAAAAEKKKEEAEAAEKKRKADADAAAEAARVADQDHRKKICDEIEAFLRLSMKEADANFLATLIVQGKIPHVTVQF